MGEIITHNIRVDKIPKWFEDLLAQSKLNHSRTKWRLMLYCQKRQLNSKYKQSKKRNSGFNRRIKRS